MKQQHKLQQEDRSPGECVTTQPKPDGFGPKIFLEAGDGDRIYEYCFVLRQYCTSSQVSVDESLVADSMPHHAMAKSIVYTRATTS